MNKVLDNKERAKYAIVCFYIVLVAYVLMFGSDFMEYQLLQSDFIDYAEAEANDSRQLMIGILAMIAQLALIITFIQWFRRAYHNLHKAGERNLLMSEGWASGAWFVPIMNLFRPCQIMIEIWDRTQRYAGSTNTAVEDGIDFTSNEKNSSSKSLVGWWWAFWIVTSITANISTQLVLRGATLDAYLLSSKFSLFADVAGIICILVAVKMIKESQEHQNRFLENWRSKSENTPRPLSDSEDILD